MQFLYRWYMFMFVCKRNHSGSCILNMLKALGSLFRQSIQKKWITEVQSGSNESVQKYFCCIATDIFPYTANISKVEEASLTYSCDRMFHRHDCIVQKTNISSCRCLAYQLITNRNWRQGGGWRWLAFKTTRSVLSLFILRMFTVIQASISCTQSSITNLARSAVDDLKVRYNCVSSAYKWTLTLWCLIISPKCEVRSRNKIGPRT